MSSNGKLTFARDKDAPWVEKYRPRSLDDVAAHKEIVDTSAYSALRFCLGLGASSILDVAARMSLLQYAAHICNNAVLRDCVDAVKRLVNENRLPHVLFYGPPGTGKTSTILAVARQLYGGSNMSSMCLELNASDDRGISIVRQQVVDFASTRTLHRYGCGACHVFAERCFMTSCSGCASQR